MLLERQRNAAIEERDSLKAEITDMRESHGNVSFDTCISYCSHVDICRLCRRQ